MPRDDLFSRLPQIWKILDQVENVVDQQGILERYLSVWDNALNTSKTDADGVLDTRDINAIPDKYLRLIGDLVGHRWKDYRSYQWNRQRIRESISKYSYKGTYLAISDLAYEHGSDYCEIIDMASTVAVWTRQGTMVEDNCYFFDPDFHHPGVFLVYLSEDIDFEHFIEDFQYIKPSGTKWYYYIKSIATPASVTISASSELQPIMDLTPITWLAVFNQTYMMPLPKESLLVPYTVDMAEKYIYWDSEETLFDDTFDVYI